MEQKSLRAEWSSDQLSEISRVNRITRKSFLSAVLSILKNRPDKMPEINSEMINQIFSKIEVVISGEENIPNEPSIFLTNHYYWSSKNFVLPPILKVVVPYQSLYLLDLLNNKLNIPTTNVITKVTVPLVSSVLDSFGFIEVPACSEGNSLTLDQREELQKEVINRLDSRQSIMISPEGRGFGHGNIGPFKSGAYYWADVSGAPIIPVSMQGFTAGSKKVSIEFGKPISINDQKGMTPREFMEDIRQRIFVEEFGFTLVEERP